MREKAKASLVQRTSSRWWLVSVHLIWPRLSAIISFHAATLASGTRKASSVSDLRDRWFRSIGQAHRNFDPSPQPPRFSFDSFFLSFFPASRVHFPDQTRDHRSRWIPRFGAWIISGRYSILVTLSNLFQISIFSKYRRIGNSSIPIIIDRIWKATFTVCLIEFHTRHSSYLS